MSEPELLGKILREIEGDVDRVENEEEKQERIRLDQQDVNNVVCFYFRAYNSPNGGRDVFDEGVNKVVYSDGIKRRMKFFEYVNEVVGEELERIKLGLPRKILSLEDITELLDKKVLTEKVKDMLSNCSEGHITRRFDPGYVLLSRRDHRYLI